MFYNEILCDVDAHCREQISSLFSSSPNRTSKLLLGEVGQEVDIWIGGCSLNRRTCSHHPKKAHLQWYISVAAWGVMYLTEEAEL